METNRRAASTFDLDQFADTLAAAGAFDFGEARAVIGGMERKIHSFTFDLPLSDECFVVANPQEGTGAFCAGYI